MSGLTISWEYLTGYAVATDPSDRERVEWPPHPGRVFMALAAAWFESERHDDEVDALRWLETIGDPELHMPPVEADQLRTPVTVYVPVNDKVDPKATTLQSAPTMPRSRQPRTFPRIWVGSESCAMHWPLVEGVDRHREALARLCRRVTRIGHSSSLVSMWVADESAAAALATRDRSERWTVADLDAECQVRCGGRGTLEMLEERYNAESRARHEEIVAEIGSRKVERKTVKGAGSKEKKAAIDERVATLEAELATLNPRAPIRPAIGRRIGYRRRHQAILADAAHSCFDSDIIVLTGQGTSRLGLAATATVMRALRGAIMSHIPQPPPEWVTGHASDGTPQRSDDDCHLACFPLAAIGHPKASGHLLGVAIAMPRSVGLDERARVLGPVLADATTGETRTIRLTMGRAGEWSLSLRTWDELRVGLNPDAWTHHPEGGTTWASVTPVVLDRFPKSDRLKDMSAWRQEVAETIAAGCARVGLPDPVEIDFDTTAWHHAVPRSMPKQRRLRADGGREMATHGDGFPPYPSRGTNAPRPQFHVFVRFDRPVVGPILLGAGRHQGYGLLAPIRRRFQ